MEAFSQLVWLFLLGGFFVVLDVVAFILELIFGDDLRVRLEMGSAGAGDIRFLHLELQCRNIESVSWQLVKY
jgi:hypothetical protein